MFRVYNKPNLFLKNDRVSRIEGKLEQLINYIAYVKRQFGAHLIPI